jgi:hypothetical protein
MAPAIRDGQFTRIPSWLALTVGVVLLAAACTSESRTGPALSSASLRMTVSLDNATGTLRGFGLRDGDGTSADHRARMTYK